MEAFLIAVADHLHAGIDQNTKFDKYFVLIDERIAPKELPFKAKLLRLNRIRIDSKHYGIQPARDECERVFVSVREFFDEVSTSVLAVNFSTVSAIDLLKEGESKSFLQAAKNALEEGEHDECIIFCRKAIYVEIEWRYDVSKFKDGPVQGLLEGWSDAPFYARNPTYIAENVNDPTDFIVLDHSRVDHDLLKEGVDTTAFWNVWRLTPEVYQTKEKTWIVKHDFGKLDQSTLADKADYVLATTIDIALAMHASRQAVRSEQPGKYFVKLAREGTLIFEKADLNSKIVGTTPTGMTQIDTDYRVPGLNDDGPYRHVSEITKGAWLWGYIHNDDVSL